jgi:putative FmdB family regulatory protein
MPIYEYRCADCRRRTSVFVRSIGSAARPRCEHCGGTRLSRLMSKFAVHRAAPSFDDDAGGLDDLDENDPRAVARWARRMRDETGEDMGPDFDEMVERMERGESPDDMMSGDADDFDDGDW